MKNILVTGASGFIGSRLIEVLRAKYRNDMNIIPLTSSGGDYPYILHKNWTYNVDDIINAGFSRIDIIVHIGGFVSKTKEDIVDVKKHFTSIENTMHLLHNLPNTPEKIIFCSTTTVYGDVTQGDYRKSHDVITEDTLPKPQNYYGYVKYCCELLIKDWAAKNGCLCQVLRLCPVFGPNEKKKAIYKMIAKAVHGEDIILTIDPQMRRNMLYIDDCCEFISNAVAVEDDFGIINIGSSKNYTYEEIVKTIIEVSGDKINYSVACNNPTGQDLVVSSEKRRFFLGDEKTTLFEAINIIYDSIRKKKEK